MYVAYLSTRMLTTFTSAASGTGYSENRKKNTVQFIDGGVLPTLIDCFRGEWAAHKIERYTLGCGYSTDTSTQVRVPAPYICMGVVTHAQ